VNCDDLNIEEKVRFEMLVNPGFKYDKSNKFCWVPNFVKRWV